MSSSPPPASPRREPIETDLSPESTALLQTSPPPPSSEPTTILGITPEIKPSMDTPTDIPPALMEETVALCSSVPSSQDLATGSDKLDEIDEKGDCARMGGPCVTNQVKNYGTSEENSTGVKKISELTRDASLPTLTSYASGLSAMAPEFFPVGYGVTSTNEIHDRDRHHHIKNGPPWAQQEILHPPTPISQIAEVAAEVADTAAMLDATPPELVTPETLSILDDIGSMYAGSPTVELVEEEPVTSLSEASIVAAEVADTAAMLDRFSPGAYVTEQTQEEAQIGTIRMVQITEPDDNLTSIEEESVVENGDSSKQESWRMRKTSPH